MFKTNICSQCGKLTVVKINSKYSIMTYDLCLTCKEIEMRKKENVK